MSISRRPNSKNLIAQLLIQIFFIKNNIYYRKLVYQLFRLQKYILVTNRNMENEQTGWAKTSKPQIVVTIQSRNHRSLGFESFCRKL